MSKKSHSLLKYNINYQHKA